MLHGFLYLSFAAAVVSLSQAFVSALSILYLSSAHAAALQSAHSSRQLPNAMPQAPGGSPRVVESERSQHLVVDSEKGVNFKANAYQPNARNRAGLTAASMPPRYFKQEASASSSNEPPDQPATTSFVPNHSSLYQALIVYILLLVVSIMQVHSRALRYHLSIMNMTLVALVTFENYFILYVHYYCTL